MAAEGNPVSGGVALLHTEYEGKHSYQVKGFLNYNRGMFTSSGDKLLMINSTNVEDLTPKAFANLLVEGPSPLLTIHHPIKAKTEECESEELCVTDKEQMVMNFSLMMVTESELEAYGSQVPSPSQPDPDDFEDDSFDDGNLLIVSMADTSFSLVVARGCDHDSPCEDCGKTNCQFNEVVVLPATAEITSSSLKKLHQLSKKDLFLKSYFEQKYITPNNHLICLNNTMSAPITIYTYTKPYPPKGDGPGIPVVLNFTDTENFFSCTTKEGVDTKILKVVQYRKNDLKMICADDPQQWSLVFYMSSGASDLRRFESALHRGWFICTKSIDNNEVNVDRRFDPCDLKYLFYIIIDSAQGSC